MKKIGEVTKQIKDQLVLDSNTKQVTIQSGKDQRLLKDYLPISAYSGGRKITPKTIAIVEEAIRTNFGVEYEEAKFNLLWKVIVKSGWTEERLMDAVDWFLKNEAYPSWTISTWFKRDVKLYPYGWYLEKMNKGYRDEDFDKYLIDGKPYFKLKDGKDIPFDKLNENKE